MIVTTIIFMVLFGVIMFGLSNQLRILTDQVARLGDRAGDINETLQSIHATQKTRF